MGNLTFILYLVTPIIVDTINTENTVAITMAFIAIIIKLVIVTTITITTLIYANSAIAITTTTAITISKGIIITAATAIITMINIATKSA